MKNIILFAGLFSSLSLSAQPQIQNSSNLPAPGYSFSFSVAPNAEPGPPGENQIWDFSALPQVMLGEGEVIESTDSPLFDSYPSTDFAYSQIYDQLSAYTHMNVTSDKMEVITYFVATPGGENDFSPNPRTVLKFPFNYQEQVVDTWQKVGESENTVTLTYDGYGTLITPSGTYNDVVRIRESYGEGEDDYQWYTLDPLIHVAVFEHYDNEMFFLDGLMTGMNESGTVVEVDVYPNPATDVMNISFSDPVFAREVEMLLINTRGQKIKSVALKNSSTRIDLKDLTDGMYLYRVMDAEKTLTTGRIVVE